jgi:hypothetical protein
MSSADVQIRVYAAGGDALSNGRTLSSQWAWNPARSLKSTNYGP